jgi:hypothetical protein
VIQITHKSLGISFMFRYLGDYGEPSRKKGR